MRVIPELLVVVVVVFNRLWKCCKPGGEDSSARWAWQACRQVLISCCVVDAGWLVAGRQRNVTTMPQIINLEYFCYIGHDFCSPLTCKSPIFTYKEVFWMERLDIHFCIIFLIENITLVSGHYWIYLVAWRLISIAKCCIFNQDLHKASLPSGRRPCTVTWQTFALWSFCKYCVYLYFIYANTVEPQGVTSLLLHPGAGLFLPQDSGGGDSLLELVSYVPQRKSRPFYIFTMYFVFTLFLHYLHHEMLQKTSICWISKIFVGKRHASLITRTLHYTVHDYLFQWCWTEMWWILCQS